MRRTRGSHMRCVWHDEAVGADHDGGTAVELGGDAGECGGRQRRHWQGRRSEEVNCGDLNW